MELRVGLYEFFAYTLAGACYAVAAGAIDVLLYTTPTVFPALAHLSVVQGVAVGVGTYVVGLILDLPARGLLRAVVRRHAQPIVAEELVKSGVLSQKVADTPWELVLSELATLHPSAVRHADSYKAASILLRNAALAASGVTGIALVRLSSGAVSMLPGLATVTAADAVTFIAGWESRKFDKWFYSTLYERLAFLRRYRPVHRQSSSE